MKSAISVVETLADSSCSDAVRPRQFGPQGAYVLKPLGVAKDFQRGPESNLIRPWTLQGKVLGKLDFYV